MTEPVLRWAWLGTVGYQDAWELQREISLARRSGALTDDVLLLLEHPPVYTMGRQGEPRHLGAGPEALVAAGAEFLEVDRGGSVTFHGPGQLVAYPIVRLAGIFPIAGHPAHGDVDRYLRALEAGLIATAGALWRRGDPPAAVHGCVGGRSEARRHRRQARGWRHDPRCRPERRDRPWLVRPDHTVRHRGSRGRVARDPWSHRSQSDGGCSGAGRRAGISLRPPARGRRARWMRCSARTHTRPQRPESTPGCTAAEHGGDLFAISQRRLRVVSGATSAALVG